MTSSLARELLEEFERDPNGLGYLDIEKLLDNWGVSKVLPGRNMQGYRGRAHETIDGFWVMYPERHELTAETVLYICGRIREIARLT